MRHFLIFLIIFSLILSSASFLNPKKVQAIPVAIIVDPYTPAAAAVIVAAVGSGTGATVGQTGNDVATWLEKAWRDYIKPIGVTILRKAILDRIVDQIISWISGEGDPAFVTDWEGFMKDATKQAGGFFLQEILGKEFMTGLCSSDWAMKINISLGKPKKFSTRAICTFDDIEKNFNKFMDNFSNGGWANWIKVTEAQNNPYGLYLMVLNEKLDREIKKATGLDKKAGAGGGFLGSEVCIKRTCTDGSGGLKKETGTWKKTEAESPEITDDGLIIICNCNKWETRTPGQTMAAGLNKSLFKDQDWLVNNEMWQSYVVAILDAAVNRLVEEGVKGLVGLAGSDEEADDASSDLVGRYADLTDTASPTTTARPFSSNQVEIAVTSEESTGSFVKIYYTDNGISPSGNILDGNTELYTQPINITGPTVLKWFGVDFENNKEGEHTQTFVPPFIIVDTTKPFTIAVAVEDDKIALVTVPFEPATIYYTLDGTEPTIGSKRYIEVLDVFGVSTLKWFSQDKAGNTEDVQTLSIATPLSDIKNLVNPTARITAPSPTTAGAYFRIDPSVSSDNDSTNKIVRYEWDFDNDENYDWWIVDYNRDGAFDESQCRSGAVCTEPSSGILNGFLGMTVPVGGAAGVVDVKYSAGFARQMGLRVTDDEGLWSVTAVTVDVE